MADVRVMFDPWTGSGERPDAVALTVDGEEAESFLGLLRGLVDVPGGALLVIPEDTDAELEWRSLAFIDEEVTLGEMRAFAAGETVNISVQAIGGSHIMTLFEWIGALLTLQQIGTWSLSMIQARVYAPRRASARRWLLDGGDVPMNLIQHVKAKPEWDVSEASAVFGLEAGDLGRLFRGVGYVYVPENTWAEQAEAASGANSAGDVRS